MRQAERQQRRAARLISCLKVEHGVPRDHTTRQSSSKNSKKCASRMSSLSKTSSEITASIGGRVFGPADLH